MFIFAHIDGIRRRDNCKWEACIATFKNHCLLELFLLTLHIWRHTEPPTIQSHKVKLQYIAVFIIFFCCSILYLYKHYNRFVFKLYLLTSHTMLAWAEGTHISLLTVAFKVKHHLFTQRRNLWNVYVFNEYVFNKTLSSSEVNNLLSETHVMCRIHSDHNRNKQRCNEVIHGEWIVRLNRISVEIWTAHVSKYVGGF